MNQPPVCRWCEVPATHEVERSINIDGADCEYTEFYCENCLGAESETVQQRAKPLAVTV